MRTVVTGGAGKLAAYLAPALAGKHELLLYDAGEPEGDRFPWAQGDITDFAKLVEAFQGADAVVHLAALRSRYNRFPMRVVQTNVLGTFCVLEAAVKQGLRKVVFASSDAVIGVAQSKNEFAPDFLPLDEEHPLKPQDPYGISKLLGEEMCRCYAVGYAIATTALRFSNILCPGDEETYLADADDPAARRKSLWAWVHVEDAVQAITKALDTDLPGHEVFHIVADDTCMANVESSQLVATYYPQVERTRPLAGNESLIDAAKAKRMLGYHPQRRFNEVLARRKPVPTSPSGAQQVDSSTQGGVNNAP